MQRLCNIGIPRSNLKATVLATLTLLPTERDAFLNKEVQLSPSPSVTVDGQFLKIISVTYTASYLRSNIPNKDRIILSNLI